MAQEDNQQERPTELLAWFAGIVEGEGSLGMYKQKFKHTTRYVPRFALVNTDILIMDTVAQILKTYGIGFHVQNRHRTPQSKPTFTITIQGFKRLAKLLPLLKPYMHSKKGKNLAILSDYITWRMSQPYKSGQGFDKERAEEVYQQLKQLNQTGILRDYTPIVLKLEDEDIVRTEWKHSESLPTKTSW